MIAQLHHVGVPKEKNYSIAEVTEIFLHNIWRDKFLQITALSMGMHAFLKNIIDSDADKRAKEYNSLLDVLDGSTETIWSIARGHIVTIMLVADYGTLDKIKGHKDRGTAVLDAAQTYTNGLAVAMGNFQKGGDGYRELEWPSMLDSAVLGPEKKLTFEGIKKLLESNCKWALVPVCDTACVTDPKCDPRGAEQ